MNTKDISRVEFEAWAVTDASPLFQNEIENPLPDGSYRTSGANAAWVTWQAARDQPAEPIIDGYPLWSGLPPPVERVALSDDEIAEIGNQSGIGRILTGMLDDDQWNNLEPSLLLFARAILATQAVAQPLIAEVARDDISDNDKILAGIQCVCVSANQEFSRCGGSLPDWDAGFFAGQLHIFEMYMDADKSAIRESADYLAKLRKASRDDVPGDAS